jgi:hypothetical protein
VKPARYHHGLAGHEALSRERLVALAGALRPDDIEHHVGYVPLLLPHGVPDRLDLVAADVARDIESNGCWMLYSRLRNYPQSAALRAVVEAEIAERAATIGDSEGGVEELNVSVLFAAAGSRVPVHFDNHHVLLLQIAGTKEVHIGSYADATRGQVVIERNLLPPRLNADSVPDAVDAFHLQPGDGLYIPPFAFHWVIGGDDVSIAASVSVRTPATARTLSVHIANGSLRKLGLRPRPPGASQRGDTLKLAALRARNRVGRRRALA